MPKPLRLEYSGAIYHVLNRGDRREDIFRDEEDREKFLAALSEACTKTEWEVQAYCLMRNHFHLVVETPQPNLVAGMKWLLGVYTKRFNIRHKECGHLFAGRYKALIVEGSGNGYLRTVCDYVHLNPVRAKLLRLDAPLETFRWSSYAEYLKPAGRRLLSVLASSPIFLDLAHLNVAGFHEALDLYAPPVLVTHTFCRAIVDHPRGLTDDQLRELGAHGGLVGLAFPPEFLGQKGSVDEALRHIGRIASLAGEDAVSIGSDWGVAEMGELGDPASLSGLLGAVACSYGPDLAKKFAFDNAHEFLSLHLPFAQ